MVIFTRLSSQEYQTPYLQNSYKTHTDVRLGLIKEEEKLLVGENFMRKILGATKRMETRESGKAIPGGSDRCRWKDSMKKNRVDCSSVGLVGGVSSSGGLGHFAGCASSIIAMKSDEAIVHSLVTSWRLRDASCPNHCNLAFNVQY
ncbi:unnamed protein product [Pieris macdunnoughi]|uniref:Uncharacterized protein n=1 Tax=Pieris macdunnoughi TaxID=345717 RepID=A0A821VE38_9NEOP|nr:unnamed protein product [Pieris macdunnoughi]